MKKHLRIVPIILSFVILSGIASGCTNEQTPAPVVSTNAPAAKTNAPAATTNAPVAAASTPAAAEQKTSAPSTPVITPAAEAPKVPAASVFPLTKDKASFKILKEKAGREIPTAEMDVFIKYEELSNVHIEWDNPTGNFGEYFNLVVATNDLPDAIFNAPMNSITKLAQDGVIVAVNDLIEKNSPYLLGWMDRLPVIRKTMTYPDSNMYYFPMLNEWPTGSSILVVRQDWLQKLNLSSPVTTADWEDTWRRMRDGDPNGNGQKDEIPFSADGINMLKHFIAAWGIKDGFYPDPNANNKINYGPIDPRYKEAITWLNRMYKEGFIDPEIGTHNGTDYNAKVKQNLVGSSRGSSGTNIVTPNATLPKEIPGFRLVATEPMKGPYGDQIHVNIEPDIRNTAGMVITSACKNPDLLARWADYWYSEDGMILMSFGIEGKQHTMVNGKPVYTSFVTNNPDGLSPSESLRMFTISMSAGPFIMSKAQVNAIDDDEVTNAKLNAIAPYMETSKKYVMPTLPLSAEDNTAVTEITGEVQKYVDEMIKGFITGDQELSLWDSYVDQVKKMRIEDARNIYQKAFDAWNKN